MPLPTINPALTQFTDQNGNLTIAAKSVMNALTNQYNQQALNGYSGTVPLAKLTPAGADGSITILNGVITGVMIPS